MSRPLAVVTVAVGILAAAHAGFAQASPAPEPMRLTLAEAVERARQSSPRLDGSSAD